MCTLYYCNYNYTKYVYILYVYYLFSFIAMTILSPGLIAGIVVVCVVVYLLTFLAGCGGGVIGYVVYQKKTKQSTGVLCVHSIVVLILLMHIARGVAP